MTIYADALAGVLELAPQGMEEEGTPGPSCDSNRQILIGISLVRNDQADLGTTSLSQPHSWSS